MTESTGKRNQLSFDKKTDMLKLFEDLRPASKTEWFVVSDGVRDDLMDQVITDGVGYKWNAVRFAEYATSKLGYLVRSTNVNGVLTASGYKFRPSPKPKAAVAQVDVTATVLHEVEVIRKNQETLHCDQLAQYALQESRHQDQMRIMEYLTRKDPAWNKVLP